MHQENKKRLLVYAVIVLISLYLDLGVPVFMFLFLSLMLLNTSKRTSGLSAYSVFNKNLETMEGTTSADQIEKELYRKMY